MTPTVGAKVSALDAEGRYRRGFIVDERLVVTMGSRCATFYRVQFSMGGLRWVRADEMRVMV